MNSIESFIQSLKDKGRPPETLRLAERVLAHFEDKRSEAKDGFDYVRHYCARMSPELPKQQTRS